MELYVKVVGLLGIGSEVSDLPKSLGMCKRHKSYNRNYFLCCNYCDNCAQSIVDAVKLLVSIDCMVDNFTASEVLVLAEEYNAVLELESIAKSIGREIRNTNKTSKNSRNKS